MPSLTPAPAQVIGERTIAVQLGDLVAGQWAQVLVELLAPPRPVGTFRLAQTFLRWRTATGWQQSPPTALIVTYTTDATQVAVVNPAVARAMEMVTAAELQTRALRDLQQGDVAGATKRLEAAATACSTWASGKKRKRPSTLPNACNGGSKSRPNRRSGCAIKPDDSRNWRKMWGHLTKEGGSERR